MFAQDFSFLSFFQGCLCGCGQASGLLVLPEGGGGALSPGRLGRAVCVHSNFFARGPRHGHCRIQEGQ